MAGRLYGGEMDKLITYTTNTPTTSTTAPTSNTPRHDGKTGRGGGQDTRGEAGARWVGWLGGGVRRNKI